MQTEQKNICKMLEIDKFFFNFVELNFWKLLYH